MHLLKGIFWVCLGIIFYNYIGYGILLLGLTRIKRLFFGQHSVRKAVQEPEADLLPEVTVVVAAYNEEDIIEEKISNCLSLSYPENKIFFLFVTDGSCDNTVSLIARYPKIQLLHQPERMGKASALNRAMENVTTPITIFCDANTMLNRSAVKRMVSHYEDPKTGGVSGEKRLFVGNQDTTAGMGEGLYWRYESILKKLDAELYTVTGAAGELFSIRTALWDALPLDVVLDDFVISTKINLRGYRIAYEPSAYAIELPSASMFEEKKRKVRISAGAFQAMLLLRQAFNVFRHPILFFQFFSHRFLRWTLTPLSFLILLIANVLLVTLNEAVVFKIVLAAQIVFYFCVLLGRYLATLAGRYKVLKICHYVFFMNFAVVLGFVRFIKGNQAVTWEKAARKKTLASIID